MAVEAWQLRRKWYVIHTKLYPAVFLIAKTEFIKAATVY